MKLIAHVGVGKTGSSSIQAALEQANEALAAKKIKYLGLMLERGRVQEKPEWQRRNGSPRFFMEMHEAQAIEDLKRVLSEEMRLHKEAGVETLVWSNEWIGERSVRVIPALELVRSQGVDVEIWVYVRRHDRWIVSAYTQWGIKFKTYPGPVLTFRDWMKGKDFGYASILKSWLEAFGGNVSVLNYDASGNVVKHFFDRLGIEAPEDDRANVSPSPERLAAWAVFNNRFNEPVPENTFASLLRQLDNQRKNDSEVAEPSRLFPSENDVEKAREKYAQDLAYVNAILVKSGEPGLELGGEIKIPKAPSDWEMNRLLLEMLFHLHSRVAQLEKAPREGS